uniref:Serine protease 44 n=1 Tax=Lygus hesperus TaxID=30085 RepID=A0A0A9WLS7_LYGHE
MKIFEIIAPFCLVAVFCAPAASQLPRDYLTPGYKEERLRRKRMVGGDEISAYDMPYMCSFHYNVDNNYIPAGTCSIFTSSVVLTSMMTMDQSNEEAIDILQPKRVIEPGFDPVTGPHFTKAKLALQHYKTMLVTAGIDRLRPDKDVRLQSTFQQREILHLFIVDTSGPGEHSEEDSWGFKMDPDNNTLQDFEFFTFKYNFVFIQLRLAFTFSSHVLPVPFAARYVEPEGWAYFPNDWNDNKIVAQQKDIDDYTTQIAPGQIATVPGWARREGNPLTFKETMQVLTEYCQWSYCSYSPIGCLEYPNEYDACFTSTSSGDVCDFDQGAALFCPFYENSVCGFLKKSVNCGASGMPAVYTPAWMILKGYVIAFGAKLQARPNWNDYPIYVSTTPHR